MLPAMDHLSGPPATCPPNAQVRATGVHAEKLLQLLAPGRLIALIPTSPVRGCDTRRGAQGDLACWPDTAPMGLRTLSYNFCCGLMPFASNERVAW
ncbi:GekBS024P [Symbiodinium sp. CCMP2592]|nr:GekBS024P [Symbiodinium sp. CCMP2592]